jgi:hypothetical protein
MESRGSQKEGINMANNTRIVVSLLVTLGLLCISTNAFAQVSKMEAFETVISEVLDGNTEGKRIYVTQEIAPAGTVIKCGRYTLTLPLRNGWLFFIDDNPWANWTHSCRYVFVDSETQNFAIYSAKMLPDNIGEFELLIDVETPTNQRDSSTSILNLTRDIDTTNQGACAHPENCYAVIISGGINQNANWIRYWNDSSAIYTTLTQVYGYRDDHIYVLMSDGTDPGDDRHRYDGTYDSSPLDLDGDGDDDIDYSATQANITTVFNTLRNTLDWEDSLFIYTTDHGGQTAGQDVYLCLWGEDIDDDELATEVDKVTCGSIMIVMEQCHSGGFVDDLSACGRTIATACSHDESSWAMPPDYLYDEFVYYWTAAVRGQFPDGTPVDADTNDDGFVSMREAFDYAYANDGWVTGRWHGTPPKFDQEHPQYNSKPSKIGENLELCGIITSPEIHKALVCLCRQKNENGSWQNHVGYTAMATLAFLNAGYTENDEVVSGGIQYLLSNVQADGGIYSWYGNYETALSILALKATGNPDYSDEMANAADYLKSIQSDDSDDPDHSWYGGWGYSAGSKNNWSDLSNSQFSAMALDAAEVPKADIVWTRFLRYLSRVQNLDDINDMPWADGRTDGGFTYSPHFNMWNNFNSYGSMTAAGIWGLRLSGVEVADDRVQAALGWLGSNEDLNFNSNPMWGDTYRYYYYMAFAKAMAMCFLSQEDTGTWYESWYDRLKEKIASEQEEDGCWNQSQGMLVDTFWALLTLQTQQPLPANLWMSIILASPADLAVYDSEDRVCSKDECDIPGATFEVNDDGNQVVNLTELEPGHYRFVFHGTGDGTVHLTVNGHRDDDIISTVTKEFEIKKYEVWESDVLVSSLVGALTINVEDPTPPPFVSVDTDIKPGSCPNPLNPKSKSVLPVAVLGTQEFDVTTIDPQTILLGREGIEEGIAPIRYSYEDVATPFEGELCDCHDLNGDGYLDLTLKFKTQELVDILKLKDVAGETIPLTLTGNRWYAN